jgi:hypothetical protein
MVNNERLEDAPGGVEDFYFAVVFAGFVLAVGGVVVSSVCVASWGLAVLAWGLAYFAVTNGDR